MIAPAHPGRPLFVNLPVADVERSKAFFGDLGFSFNPAFTDETAACMLVGEQASVMMLGRAKFAEFAKLPIADPRTHTLGLYCFGVASRDEVDAVSVAALAAGGTEADDAEDLGFMYSRSFFDLDGHGWQVMWMADTARGFKSQLLQIARCTPRPRNSASTAGTSSYTSSTRSARPAWRSARICSYSPGCTSAASIARSRSSCQAT